MAWSRLPWQPREGESPSRADYRDIVMISGEDPTRKGLEDRSGVRQCKAIADQRPA